MPDLTARRPEVVRRLIERGVPVRALQALLPEWEPVIEQAVAAPRDLGQPRRSARTGNPT